MSQSAAPIRTTADVPLIEGYGTRTVRRRRVVALYAGFTIMWPAYALAYGRHDIVLAAVALGIMFVGFCAFCYGFYTLLQRTFINSANVNDAALDERQRERRNRAVVLAFRALGVTLTIAPVWATVGLTAPQWTWLRDGSLITFASFAVFLVGMTLPTAILAWTEPDPIAQEDAA